MRIYIAGPYPLRDSAIELMNVIEAAGHEVTSTWLRFPDTLSDEFAREDLADVARADALLAYNPPGWENIGTGGRHVELGYALALGMPVFLFGETTNIFHYLSDIIRCNESNLVDKLNEHKPETTSAQRAVQAVVAELLHAEAKHKPLNSAHEGYAVIREELDELWDDVKADRLGPALREAIQVAAMGLRFVVNLTPKLHDRKETNRG